MPSKPRTIVETCKKCDGTKVVGKRREQCPRCKGSGKFERLARPGE